MPRQRRSNSFFGGAGNFSGSQLPTYEELGEAWKASRLELEAEQPGSRVVNREVAKDVRKIIK